MREWPRIGTAPRMDDGVASPRPRGRSGRASDRAIWSSGCSRGGAVADRGAFLDPSLLHLHDPSGLPGIDRAAERLLEAARAGEPIVVYGDYDVDGITATAILFRMLRALEPGARVETYIPHRLDEGYGLNAAALEGLASDGARVVVSVDCGITAAGPARAAKAAGLDLIITDHHNLPAPGRPGARGVRGGAPAAADDGGPVYPFGELCGAGVAYKLAWRLATMHNGSDRVAERSARCCSTCSRSRRWAPSRMSCRWSTRTG
jgi:single-stranded-DNA-specific exonuclease